MSAQSPTVATRHRSVAAGAVLWLGVAASPDARAEAGTKPASAAESRESYGLPLAAGYVIAPALAGVVGAGVFELTNSDDDDIDVRRSLAIATGSSMFVLPAALHLYYADPERALRSFGSMLGVTLIGAAAFGSLGYLIASSSCEETEAEGCGVETESITLIGVATGATLGYVGYAIYDVLSNAELPAPNETTHLQLWLAPVADRSGAFARLGGLQFGGALRF